MNEKEKINKKYKKIIIFWIIIIIFFIIISSFLIFWSYSLLSNPQKTASFNPLKSLSSWDKNKKSKVNLNEDKIPRFIDGIFVEPGQENVFPLAVMIDNHLVARPPSSLNEANLVIEAEAEGGITRFLAIFADNKDLNKIGPIRSVRPYFIDWSREFSALLAHVGGSPEALAILSKEHVLHINEFYNEHSFWRDKERTAPHNVYTSSKLLRDYLIKKNIQNTKFFSYIFKDDIPLEQRPVNTEINLNYQLADFWVTWKFDRANNDYIRYQGGQAHVDVDNKIINSKNVIVQYAQAKEIDDELRLKLSHIGTGTAIVCMDGICKSAVWSKRNSSARTRFYDLNQQEIKFNRGKTWIEIIRPEYDVSY